MVHMVFRCVVDLDGTHEKKTEWSTLQEAQKWAVTQARIVPGVGKYTVTILQDDTVVKVLF
jgi:hypothetical protein